jgi:hypothetical protein
VSIKGALPWVGVAAVVSINYWFPPIYRAVPTWLWLAFVAVTAARGVWQWVEYFARKRGD